MTMTDSRSLRDAAEDPTRDELVEAALAYVNAAIIERHGAPEREYLGAWLTLFDAERAYVAAHLGETEEGKSDE